MDNQELTEFDDIRRRIIFIRNRQVMIDKDLAELYGVEIRVMNQAVKRNIERFPERFMFQLTKDEQEKYNCLMSQYNPNLKSQIVISSSDIVDIRKISKKSSWGGKRSLSYAFTQQGVAMLSAVLRSDIAVEVSVKIMDAFVAMQQFISNYANLFYEIDIIKEHLEKSDLHIVENDKKIEQLILLMDKNQNIPKQGVFCAGQIFDAYVFITDLIKEAKKEIVVIDNYIDTSIFLMLSKRNENVKATIITRSITEVIGLDIKRYDKQYPLIELIEKDNIHDRFLIIDNDVYHIGASLKDLGKKLFAFSKMEFDKDKIISSIN